MSNTVHFSDSTNVAIIGAGGIGSFFCNHLSRMLDQNQLPFRKRYVTVFDFDVVEAANLRHQDFKEDENSGPKAAIQGLKYGLKACCKEFTEKDCGSFDMFVICADNPGIRRIIYQHCIAYRKPFLDMRSEGKNIVIVTHKADPAFLMHSLGAEPKSVEGRSCQLAEDTSQGIIQMGNMAVAPKGMQVLLDMHRQRQNPELEIPSFVMEELSKSLSVVGA